MTLGQWLEQTESRFDRAGLSSARLDAQVLLAASLNKTRSWVLAHEDEKLSADRPPVLADLVTRRLKREPVAYLIGYKEFYGRTFKVDPNVLIPRPETEHLVSAVIESTGPNQAVLDVGTGSGCIAITLALERADLNLSACDNSEAPLTLARQNAANLSAPVNFYRSDLLENVPDGFGVLVANLPYVSPQWAVSPETNFEPPQALFADENGLEAYHRFLPAAADYFSRQSLPGQIFLEADPRQSQDLAAAAKDNQFIFKPLSDFVYHLKFI